MKVDWEKKTKQKKNKGRETHLEPFERVHENKKKKRIMWARAER